MEFPNSNPNPGFHPGSVNQGAFSVPNSNPRPSDFFGRKASLEAGSQGVMAINAIDLGGGGDDGRRGFKPISVAPVGVSSNLSFGQGNYSGVTGVSAADSDIMLSLDDILNDLQKKVVSGNSNARSLTFGSVRTATQENLHGGGVADLPERNEQTIGEVVILHETERNKAPHGGFFSFPGVNEQQRGESAGSRSQHEFEVAGPQGKNGHEQQRGESSGSHYQHEGEVAGPQGKSGHQQVSEVLHLQVANEPSGQHSTNEHHNDEAAVFQGEGTSGSLHDNDKSKVETTASAGGIHDHGNVEVPELFGTNDHEKAEDVQRSREAENLQQAEPEVVGGGELQPFLSTPKRGRLVSRKPIEIIDSPDWLPKGWCTEQRTREAGSSAGTKDKYYYDPVSQRRFRSKSEVLSFLETGKVGRYKSKIKPEADDTRKRNTSDVLLKNLNSIDPNIRPTKVRWVYDDFNSSWIPFVNEKDLNGYNNKEGEHNFDLNHNSGDACDHVQAKANVLKYANPSTNMRNNVMQLAVVPIARTQKKAPEDALRSLSHPCMELAVQTLSGDIPDVEENQALMYALQNYFEPQATAVQNFGNDSGEPTTVGSFTLPTVSDYSPCDAFSSSAEKKIPLTKNIRESSASQKKLSAADDLPQKRWNSCTYDCKEKQLVRKRDKDLLEPLGRKLCNHALDFLKGHSLSTLQLEKRSKKSSMPFQDQSILTASFTS